MHSGSHDLPQKFLQIKQEDKFFSRLLSKEHSKNESSFRVLYYGGASGAVPFMWESQPGTPKHRFSDTSLPPLTPPPSYQSSSSPQVKSMKKHTKAKYFHSIFHRLASRKDHVSPSFSSYSISSSSSSSYSVPSTPMNSFIYRKKSLPRSKSTVDFGYSEDDDELQVQAHGSPSSTLCFAGRDRSSKKSRGQDGIRM
ncbi:unnamed protein product [Ilex paraguariensis]|uniref:Uncharacterized protein n=1 Tax=Ilex paraguariensis TaxID=185542 RepID=A0ABC8SZ46_9AQUA